MFKQRRITSTLQFSQFMMFLENNAKVRRQVKVENDRGVEQM